MHVRAFLYKSTVRKLVKNMGRYDAKDTYRVKNVGPKGQIFSV